MTIQENINSQNIELWNDLSSKFDFKLIYSPTEISWRVDSSLNPIEIYTSDKSANIPAFTHELLHVYIEYNGMSTDGDLINSIYGDESFEILTTNALFARIHNWCCHTKMFPYFIKMGFDDSSFISDRIKMGFGSYLLLKLQFLSTKISKM